MKKSLLVFAAVATLSAPAIADVNDPTPIVLSTDGTSSTFQGTVNDLNQVDQGLNVFWTDKFTFEMGASGNLVGSFIQSSTGRNLRYVIADDIVRGTFADDPRVPLLLTRAGGGSVPLDTNAQPLQFEFLGLSAGTYTLTVKGLAGGVGNLSYSGEAHYATAVPEPSTYALLALGLGAVGLMRRSRMRREE